MAGPPAPHPNDRMAALRSAAGASSWMNSFSHCRSIVTCSISMGRPSNRRAMRRAYDMIPTSRSPPARHTVTHVPQPTNRTLSCPASTCLISGMGFRLSTLFSGSPPPLEAAGHQYAIDSALEGGEEVLYLHFARAGDVHDAHVCRVLHAPGAGQVGGGVGAEVAAERQDRAVGVGGCSRRAGISSGLVCAPGARRRSPSA